jgi:hypothetical protein
VPTSADRAFEQMLDVGALAACLPGAEPWAAADGRCHRGVIALGPTGVRCEASLRPVDADDDERAVTLRLAARDCAGPAQGSALLRSRVLAGDGGARVELVADVHLASGHASPQATAEWGATMLEEFGRRLERRMREQESRQLERRRAVSATGYVAAALLVLIVLLARRGLRGGGGR